MASMLDELRTLTVAELAAALGLEQWRLREMIAQGTAPPYFKVGRTFRFPLLAAKRWLEEQTTPTKGSDDAAP